MRLSTTDIYAFKALAFLGLQDPNAWIHSDSIAESTHIPKPYLMRLLAALSSLELVATKKGAGGGYKLAKPAQEIPLSDVLRAIDGPVAALSCASRNWHKSCPEEPHCHARSRIWIRIRDAILAVLENTSVQDLVEDAAQGTDYMLCLEHLLRPTDFSLSKH
ncbi:MAG: Rrf2 family transcriptional regulator [Deinococcales bacterium]